jgi:hypothetical protein
MIQAKAGVHVYSLMTPEQSRTAHVEHVTDPNATLADLVAGSKAAGRDGSVLVLPFGQLTVPVVG